MIKDGDVDADRKKGSGKKVSSKEVTADTRLGSKAAVSKSDEVRTRAQQEGWLQSDPPSHSQ